MTKSSAAVQPEALLAFQPKPGYKVYDRRFGPLIQYEFREDMVQAEFDVLVNEVRLKEAQNEEEFATLVAPMENMMGRSAPNLSNAAWLEQRHELAGLSYILHFWAD
ncbi:MAG: hypothetical protein ACKV19_09915 [Verrucomicrobiales bacterium]